MGTIKRAWHFLFVEPFTWLFYCFFQPDRFREQLESKKSSLRIIPLIRLILPLFCISYLPVLLTRIIIAVSGNLHFSSGGWATLVFTAAWATLLGIAIGVFSGFAGGLTFGIALAVAAGIALGATGLESISAAGIVLAIVGGGLLGITQGNRWGIIPGLVLGILWGLVGYFAAKFMGSVAFGVLFIGSYLLGYYRLPLYLLSGPSSLKAYFASRKTPSQVFDYLHKSSLYWDERIFLPLPGLEQTLLIAADQSFEKTLEVVTFIATKRPQQTAAAKAVSLSMALEQVKKCENLRGIANISTNLAELISPEIQLIEPRWLTHLMPLYRASQSADQYYNANSWQIRRTSLKNLLESLENQKLDEEATDNRVAIELGQIADKWQKIALYEQERLEKVLVHADKIPNPYTAGPPLEASNNLFVGRYDVMLRFQEALLTIRPSIFLLKGERRMGKSSILRQLPRFLGENCLSILFDLQRSMLTNIGTFLSTISEELSTMMMDRNITVNQLDTLRLVRASEENETMAYSMFDEWFQSVKAILKDSDRKLLLMFDEYEKLEDAEQDGKINLVLLLDWLVSLTQTYSQLILLFCGTQTPDELGKSWEEVFAQVKEFKVSFLNPEDARQLILYPLPDFPGNEIYNEEVIGRIIEQTGCHPFLIQAVCEALIEYLNDEIRYPAQVKDVDVALNQVLAEWWETYFRDLWERTDQNQRICLFAVTNLVEADLSEITRQSRLNEDAAGSALQTLLKRDLIRLENNCYHLAAPIFAKWVERSL